MKENYFYIIKDNFFEKFNDPYLKANKGENRPHYFCFKDDTDGIFWVIPMSTKIEKYKKIISNKEKQGKPCDIVHICRVYGKKEMVFLIQDMFPITEKYILRSYTIAKVDLKLVKEKDINIMHNKAKRILKLINKNIKFLPCQIDVLKIKNELLSELNGLEFDT